VKYLICAYKKLYVYTCWIGEINSWPAALGETSINLDKKLKILIFCSMLDELGFMRPVHVRDILPGVALGQVPSPLVTFLACIVFYAW
jgi:hypothetical protein